MTLIDYFNAFQAVSKAKRFSANARSLYYAILGEFNSLQYPPSLKLFNTDLQKLSGINSTSAFDSARNALINANLIAHQKQFYTLKDFRNTSKTFEKDFRKSLETFEKGSLDSITLTKNKEKEKEEETPATAFFNNNMNSPEVQETWFKCEGEQIPGGVAIGLYELEKMHGAENVCRAILTASQANTLPRLSLNFIKAVLERQLKGGEKIGKSFSRNVIVDNAQYAGEDTF